MKRFLTLLLLSIVMFGALTCPPTTVVAQEEQGYSSSTNSADVAVVESVLRSAERYHYFQQYPLDTAISNQYASQGIIFGGDSPFISTDSANPTSPVLSGTPRFAGAIEGHFVDPSDGTTATIVESFRLDAGYFDELGSTRIVWFDSQGNKLGQRTNSQMGIETFEIQGGNIARWRMEIVENEPNGFGIDNISLSPVQASVLFREKR
ncbi:MAG: hypothetical protein M9927_03830 [Anaerolineae bacterium]|nr:hypothetical protein [Anaerolineae bacterium]